MESEGNKQDEYDKYNRVDILVKSQNNELLLVEVQNDSEIDYFQRMLYGVSKLVTEYIKEGEPYGTIKKIYSINIIYFGLGQGKDYVYEYKGEFLGLHENDTLFPTVLQKQAELYKLHSKLWNLFSDIVISIKQHQLLKLLYHLPSTEPHDRAGT